MPALPELGLPEKLLELEEGIVQIMRPRYGGRDGCSASQPNDRRGLGEIPDGGGRSPNVAGKELAAGFASDLPKLRGASP